MGDARQYVYICAQGYSLPGQLGSYPPFGTLPGSGISRVNWMPVYALLQCGLHHLAGVSLVFTGPVISALAVGLTLFLGTLTLANLGVRGPAIHALAALVAPIGGRAVVLSLHGGRPHHDSFRTLAYPERRKPPPQAVTGFLFSVQCRS
jgi:hypothetical protein